MRYALSIYWGGTVVDALDCDYESSRELGLHCPFCKEAVFLRGSYHRIQEGKSVAVAPSFVHYAHTGQDCELRASRPEGDAYIQTLMIESKNQRLILFNKHFIDILATKESSPLHFQSDIKSFRKILGKDFAKPLISYYQKVMGREYTDQEFSEIIAEITNYLAEAQSTVAKFYRDKRIAKLLQAGISMLYTERQNLRIVREAATWLATRSARWSLDRIISTSIVKNTYLTAGDVSEIIIDFEPNFFSSRERVIKRVHDFYLRNPRFMMLEIVYLLYLVDWRNVTVNFKGQELEKP